jgi:hypothetical protein
MGESDDAMLVGNHALGGVEVDQAFGGWNTCMAHVKTRMKQMDQQIDCK